MAAQRRKNRPLLQLTSALIVLAVAFAGPLWLVNPLMSIAAVYVAALTGLVLFLVSRWVHNIEAEKAQLREAIEDSRTAAAQARAAEGTIAMERERLRLTYRKMEERAEADREATRKRLEREAAEQLSVQQAEWYAQGVEDARMGIWDAPSLDEEQTKNIVNLEDRRPRRGREPDAGSKA